jgi:hypothetical protein
MVCYCLHIYGVIPLSAHKFGLFRPRKALDGYECSINGPYHVRKLGPLSLSSYQQEETWCCQWSCWWLHKQCGLFLNRMQLISRAGQLFLTGSPLWPKTVKLPRPKLKLEYLLHALNNILVGPHHLSGGHTIVTSPSVANCVHSSSITIFKTISYCK